MAMLRFFVSATFLLTAPLVLAVRINDAESMDGDFAKVKEKGNTIVKINAGGKTFSTQRETLELSPVLQSILAGTQEWPKDKNGVIFLDFDPPVFAALLSFLRQLRTNGGVFSVPQVNPDHKEQFEVMVDFLGLVPLIYGRIIPIPEQSLNLTVVRDVPRPRTISVEGDFVSMKDQGQLSVAGQAPLLGGQEVTAWKVTLGDDFTAKSLKLGVAFVKNETSGELEKESLVDIWQKSDVGIFELDEYTKKFRVFIGRAGGNRNSTVNLGRTGADLQKAVFRAKATFEAETNFELRVSPATLKDMETAGFL